jgi:HK97 family phage major capsid protein
MDFSTKTKVELIQERDGLKAQIEALDKKGVDNLTGQEVTTYSELLDQRAEYDTAIKAYPTPESIKARHDQHNAVTAVQRPNMGGKTTAGNGAPTNTGSVEMKTWQGFSETEVERFFTTMGPFKSYGHFFHDVRSRTYNTHTEAMSRWQETMTSPEAIKAIAGDDIKAIQGMGEFNDSAGGVFVVPQISDGIWNRSLENDFSFPGLPGIALRPMTGNSITLRARNDKSRANGSRDGGVRGYAVAEGADGTASYPTFRTIELKLCKKMVLIPATEELLEDSAAANAEIADVAAAELRFVVNDACVNGVGNPGGDFKGLMAAEALVTVASSAGGTNTVTATDVDNMWVRRAKPSGAGYVWLGNQEIETQLSKLVYSVTNTAGQFAYVPGGLFGDSVLPKLKGKPVYYTEFNAALGTTGDIILFDPSQYAIGYKTTGIRGSVSAHVYFASDQQLFKYTIRMDGRPLWDAALTRYKGSSSLSPIVVMPSTRT